jgi:hypothetical protein
MAVCWETQCSLFGEHIASRITFVYQYRLRSNVRCTSRSVQSRVPEEGLGLAENSTRLRPASFAR